MRQQVEVKSVTPDGYAQVMVVRRSACSGDCHSCGGCSAITQKVQVCARNQIGARPGDQVIVETSTKTVFAALAVVYCLPLLLLLVGYFVGAALAWLPGLCSFFGFALGIGCSVLYNRRVTKRGQVQFTITSFAAG